MAAFTVALAIMSLQTWAQQEEKNDKKQKTYTRKYYKGGEKYRAMESPKYYDRKGRDEDAGENIKTRRREEKYRKVAEGTTTTDKHAAREQREEDVREDNSSKAGDATQGQDKYKKARYEEKDGRSRREARRSARREKWENGEGRNNQ
jgi:hypothetical protein